MPEEQIESWTQAKFIHIHKAHVALHQYNCLLYCSLNNRLYYFLKILIFLAFYHYVYKVGSSKNVKEREKKPIQFLQHQILLWIFSLNYLTSSAAIWSFRHHNKNINTLHFHWEFDFLFCSMSCMHKSKKTHPTAGISGPYQKGTQKRTAYFLSIMKKNKAAFW